MAPDYKPRRHQRQVYEFAAAAAPRRPIGHHSPELQRIHAPLRHEPGKCAALRAPPPFGKRAARPILARAWPAYSLDDPKTLTCRGRCWWSCRSSMRSASPARARTGAQACSRSATATPADSPLIGTECLSTTLQHTCDQQTLPPGVRALLSAGSSRPTSGCTRACRRAPPGDLTQGLDLTAFFLSPQSIVVC